MAPITRQTANSQNTGNDENQELTDVAQLQELIRTMAQERQADREQITQLLSQITALTAANMPNYSPGPTPNRPMDSIGRETPSTTTASSRSNDTKYSKRRPDPPVFTNGVDPVFESWKIQMQAKLRANADHYPTEEDKMEYVFSRTLGDAQKHLLPRIDEDSPFRFMSTKEMYQHLAAIYVNPNKVRDAQFEYHRLRMQVTQTFSDFQTTFLHLAGEGQVPRTSLRLDLYDKLPPHLQRMILPTLDDLDTYEQLASRCLALDTGLKRIEEAEKQLQPQYRKRKSQTTFTASATTSGTAGTLATPPRLSPTPEIHSRRGTPAETTVTCYNCHKPGHFASSCPEPKKSDLKAIEEELSDTELGKEEP
jgi:hypothetical protein